MTLEEILANPTQLIRQLALLESDESDTASLELAAQVRAAIASRPELAPVQTQIENAPILAKPDRIESSLQVLEQAGHTSRASELRERIRRRQEISQIRGRPDTVGGIADGLSIVGDGLGFVGSKLADVGRSALEGIQNFGQAIEDNEFFAGGGITPDQGISQGQAIGNAVLDRLAPERQLQAEVAALTPTTPLGNPTTSPGSAPPPLIRNIGLAGATAPSGFSAIQQDIPALLGPQPLSGFGAIQQDIAPPNPLLAGLTAEKQAIDAAILQQTIDGIGRENQRRAFEQVALQQIPTDNRNILGNAAALSGTPSIGAAPANVASTIPLAQRITGDISVPNQTQAARTNLAQQNRTAQTEEAAQNALLKERLKALEIARTAFVNDIALPTLFRPR